MEDFEVLQKVKEGDCTVLREWVNIHSEKIERFALQYGMSSESAFQVTSDTFTTFRKVLKNMDEEGSLLTGLYKIQLKNLLQVQAPTSLPDNVFLFTEDADLHSLIVQLDVKYRMPLIFSSFQGLSDDQIATIIGCSVCEVKANIRTAKSSLDGDHLEKRLELLRKSYDRLPVKFKAEQVVGEIVSPKPKNEKFNMSKWLITATVLLIGILVVSFFFSNNGETDKIAMSDFEIKYKEERDKQQEMLMLENDRLGELDFIKKADRRMALLLAKEETSLQEVLEIEFEDILSEMRLPSEMIGDLSFNLDLSNNEDESIAFLGSYRSKLLDIISVYERILWDYREDVENFKIKKHLNKADQMMNSSEEFPEELKNILITMKEQSIQLVLNTESGKIVPTYLETDNFGSALFNLHSNVHGYAYMLMGEMMLHPDVESFYYLLMLEDTLSKVKEDKILYPEMKDAYVSLFYKTVKGSAADSIYDEQGILKDEYKEVWQRLSIMPGAGPTKYLLSQIVGEMEASDWKSSKSWDEFNAKEIEEILELARSGELERLMYGDPPIVENDSITLPDLAFFNRIKQLYNEFKASKDISLFKDLSPIYIVGVFDYANDMEDPQTMYALLRKNNADYMGSEMIGSLEAYVAQWQKGFSFFKDANRIDFSKENMVRFGHDFHAYIEISFDNGSRGVSVYLDDEQNWFMEEERHDPLPSAQIENEVRISVDFENEVKELYGMFSNGKDPYMLSGISGSRIVGLYYYTAELEDYETQYAMHFQDKDYPSISKEEFIVQSRSQPKRKMKDLFKSISFNGQQQDENGNWPGTATLPINIEKNPNEELEKKLSMIWQDNVWYILYNPTE